jgi:protein phosphatase
MIPRAEAHLTVSAGTHEGMKGKNNEDNFSVTAYELSTSDQTPSLFAIVADGIGGHRAGEVASNIAVEMIAEAVKESDASQPTAIMQAAILQASQTILAQAEAEESKQGMGTTVSCAWIIDDKLYTANVGNSRVYLLRGPRLIQLNIDHTWVQEAVDVGALTQDQARHHPHANIIRRYLGARKPIEVDLRIRLKGNESDRDALNNQGLKLQPNDRLMICSDGLNDMVTNTVIRGILASHSADDAVEALIEAANEAGGKDNITVVVIDMPNFTPRTAEDEMRDKRFTLGCSLAGVVGSIAMVVLISGYWFGVRPLINPTPTATVTATATFEPTWTPRPTDSAAGEDEDGLPTIQPLYTYTPARTTPVPGAVDDSPPAIVPLYTFTPED